MWYINSVPSWLLPNGFCGNSSTLAHGLCGVHWKPIAYENLLAKFYYQVIIYVYVEYTYISYTQYVHI